MRLFIYIFSLFFFLFNNSIQSFPIPESKKAVYDIIRKDKVIGKYEILFSEKDKDLIIETNIEIEVKVLFLVVYKFSHQSKEVWEDGNFKSIDAHSKFEDEREYFIQGEIEDDFFLASGMDGELKLDKNLIPSNYWDIDVMYQKEIFDTQKGIVRKLQIKEIGKEELIFDNHKIVCKKFSLNASRNPKDKFPFPEYTLWYSENKELMKFKFRNPNDKKIVEIIRKQ